VRNHLSIAPYSLKCYAHISDYNFIRIYETLY
jgi:hypothetical protein